MNDILMYNKYISIFTKLYNYIASNKYKQFDEVEGLMEWYNKKHKSFRNKNKISEFDKYHFIKENVYKELDNFIEEECATDNIVSFSSLWQFCQFVRYAEKIVFYENIPDNLLYVDSDMLDVKERVFAVNNKSLKTQFKFKLEKVDDNITKQECKVITLNVCRQYGKEMNNIFIIVNEDIKINDQSDEYLINTVNLILEDSMKSTLRAIFAQLFEIFYDKFYHFR